MPESPASSPRSFDFADLGRPRPKSARTLPNVPDADASGQLEELSADDILESDDIDALEAAAAGIASFDVDVDAAQSRAVEPPAAEPSGFEVADLGTFDEVEVEGLAARPTLPSRQPAPIAVLTNLEPVKVEPAPITVLTNLEPAKVETPKVETPKVETPKVETIEASAVSMKIDYAPPNAATLVGVPPAPVTSPLPLEESVIVAEPVVEKTLEIRGNDMAKVTAAAAKLASEPEQTEVLVRSAMPSMLQTQRGGVQPYTPAPPLAQAANGRPSSIAPVALDVAKRPPMPSIPTVPVVPARMSAHAAAPRSGLSGLAIGGIAAAAALLVSLVGVGGYAASRAMSAKSEAVAVAPADAVGTGEAAAAAGAAAGLPAASDAPSAPSPDPAGAASSPIDVSSLPSAPVPGAAPHGFTGKGSFAVTPPPAQVAPPPVAAAPAAPNAPPAGRPSGGALPAPGGRVASSSGPAGAPLPPPPSAPAAVAAPAAPAQTATTGIVHVDPNLRAVVVDGSYRRANDGALTVSCGTHRIKAGMKDQQTINVPCGGSVSL